METHLWLVPLDYLDGDEKVRECIIMAFTCKEAMDCPGQELDYKREIER